jgi:hypothetical protein
VVGVLLWLVNRFIAHAFTSTIILISASFGPSTVRVNTSKDLRNYRMFDYGMDEPRTPQLNLPFQKAG